MLGWILFVCSAFTLVRIFFRTEERHLFTEKQICHNKIKYSANDPTVHPKNMLYEVKNRFIKLHCLCLRRDH